MSGISLSLFARLRGRNVKIAIVYVESTLALEENFASDCRAELRNTIDADVAVFWLEVFGGHAEKRVDFMLGSLSDFPGRVGMFPAFDLRAEPERPSSSSDGPAALRCESERVISSVTDYLFPGRYFFYTDYHLSTEGAALRTQSLVRDIAAAMR